MIDTKRVIVLSWFNTLMNRLFGPDDNSRDEVIFEEQKNDYEVDEAIKQSNRKQASSFRFPIVSDAEIYGWDEESTREGEVPQPTPYRTDKEDDYEPTPLYENDRWTSEPVVSNVYRSGSSAKYGTMTESKRTILGSVEKEYQQEQPVQVKTLIQKRSSRPFSPTSVPSPVYGYMNPRKEIQPLSTEDQVELPQIDEVDFEQVVHEERIVPYETKDAYADEGEPTIIVRSPMRISEIVPNTIEIYDDTQQTELELPVIASDISTLQVDTIEPESVVIESTEMEHTKHVFPEDVVEHTDLTEEPEPEPVPEQRKERIVPFNVLMLKSDKEKSLKASVAPVEMETEIKHVPNNPPPLFQKAEEISQELQEQPSDSYDSLEEEPYYAFPLLDYLIPPEAQIEDVEWLNSQSEKLEEALSHFAVQATVIEAVQGPTVTRFELTVGQGTKVSKVRNLTDDLKLALAAEDIRIQAPIPGRSSIGIEIPNRKTRAVRISEVIATESFQASTSPLEAVLGLSLTGTPVTLDLRKMPHGMIAGATGSGKSVCINSILVSLLFKAAPTDLKMMLIDPKMVELAPFNGIPHLISPVITDVKAATAALKWAVAEMERRYELLAHAGVRDIERYNKIVMDSRRFSLKMPYLLIVIDELADLMMMAPADGAVSI